MDTNKYVELLEKRVADLETIIELQRQLVESRQNAVIYRVAQKPKGMRPLFASLVAAREYYGITAAEQIQIREKLKIGHSTLIGCLKGYQHNEKVSQILDEKLKSKTA